MSQQTMPDAWDLPIASGQIVQDVEGDLTSAKLAPALQPGGNQLLKLGLTNIKIHKSLTAYPYTQFEIEVPYAMKNARWKALTDSLQTFIGVGKTFSECKGMRIRFGWATDITSRVPDPETPGNWIDGEIEGWRVTGVDGANASSETQGTPGSAPAEEVDMDAVLIELANGRTEADFTQEAMKDTRIKKAPEILDQVFQQNAGILAPFIEDGRLELDDDVFKIPAGEEETEDN